MVDIKFWNDAIKFYTTNNNHNYVFVSITKETLKKVIDKYLESQPDTRANNVEKITAEESYLNAIASLLQSAYALNNHIKQAKDYPFLFFSILSMSAFENEEARTQSYWKQRLGRFLVENLNQHLESPLFQWFIKDNNNRNEIIDAVFKELNEQVRNMNPEKPKEFFDFKLIKFKYVGRILAHSIFQGNTIKQFQKIIINLGYHDETITNWEDDYFDEVFKEAKKSAYTNGVNRIAKLYDDEHKKELIIHCLKIWLKHWVPNESEISDYTKERKKTLKRIWTIDRGNKTITFQHALVTNKSIGLSGQIFNTKKTVFLDIDSAIKTIDKQYIYILQFLDKESFLEEEFEIDNLKLKINKNNRRPVFLKQLPLASSSRLWLCIENNNKKIISESSETILLLHQEDQLTKQYFDEKGKKMRDKNETGISFSFNNEQKLYVYPKLKKSQDISTPNQDEVFEFRCRDESDEINLNYGIVVNNKYVQGFDIEIEFPYTPNEDNYYKLSLGETEEVLNVDNWGYYNLKTSNRKGRYTIAHYFNNLKKCDRHLDIRPVNEILEDTREIPSLTNNETTNLREIIRENKPNSHIDENILILRRENLNINVPSEIQDFCFSRDLEDKYYLELHKSRSDIFVIILEEFNIEGINDKPLSHLDNTCFDIEGKEFIQYMGYCEYPIPVSEDLINEKQPFTESPRVKHRKSNKVKDIGTHLFVYLFVYKCNNNHTALLSNYNDFRHGANLYRKTMNQ